MSEEINARTIGEAAYAGYWLASEGRSLIDLKPLPGWLDQSADITAAWERAARTAFEWGSAHAAGPATAADADHHRQLAVAVKALQHLAADPAAARALERIAELGGIAGDGQQAADLDEMFLSWLGEEFEIVADASYEESDLKHAFIAGHGAAVRAGAQ